MMFDPLLHRRDRGERDVRHRHRRLGDAQGLAGLAGAEADGIGQRPGGGDHAPAAGGRIEIADLKERVRKLEAIAAGIDL